MQETNIQDIKKDFLEAVNWNTPTSPYAQMFWDQSVKQFWTATEYIPSLDVASWKSLDRPMQEAFMRSLGGLTLLDTLQGNVGMNKILEHTHDLQNKAVIGWNLNMENIHAQSYSTIFTTVASKEDIDSTFEWVIRARELQYKAKVINELYQKLSDPEATAEDIYLGHVGSVLLESFLFYSGFFLPLWLAGNGKMKASADIIKKIIADESIHGVFIGLLAQEHFEKIPETDREQVLNKVYDLLDDLYANEAKYTDYLYTDIGLSSEVKEYVKYNANKALMNLGLEAKFEHDDINPIVLNGLNLETTQHDFFSMKSTNYEKAIAVTQLKDEDFKLDLSLAI